jgi:hypothetical protein
MVEWEFDAGAGYPQRREGQPDIDVEGERAIAAVEQPMMAE